MAERPCREAQIGLTPLAQARFPKVVVTGTWDQAHPAYRASTGDALGRRSFQALTVPGIKCPVRTTARDATCRKRTRAQAAELSCGGIAYRLARELAPPTIWADLYELFCGGR
jgi:hypothetical protein